VAYYVRRDPELIDEIVHQTFVQAFRALDRFDAGRPLGPWLKQIARNQALDVLRRRRRESVLKKDLVEDALTGFRETHEPPLEQLNALRECMALLKDASRTMVEMHYFSHASLTQVAEALGRSAGGVRAAMLQIRRSLRSCLEQKGMRP